MPASVELIVGSRPRKITEICVRESNKRLSRVLVSVHASWHTYQHKQIYGSAAEADRASADDCPD